MKKTLLFLLLVAISGCSPIKTLYNDFGPLKEQQSYTSANEPIRIYLDRNGYVYPEFRINSNLFEDHNSLLEDVYLEDNPTLLNIFKSEGISYETSKSAAENIEDLKVHLDRKYSSLINKSCNGKKLVFLIHGYNNNGEKASVSFSRLRVAVTKLRPDINFQFVEIYWDGMNNGDKMTNTLKIWDNAQYSAALAGLGLRRILNKVNCGHSYVITHSLGAAVITEALFNVRRFKDEFYNEDPLGMEIIQMRKNDLYDSPASLFTVGMLTPAIPGENVFSEYYQRTVNGREEHQDTAPYKFINGFNEFDIATTKWKFSKYIGSTTLACNEKEHEKVSSLFKGDTNVYDRVVFSKSYGKKQTSHGVKEYIENENFQLFISKIFDSKK